MEGCTLKIPKFTGWKIPWNQIGTRRKSWILQPGILEKLGILGKLLLEFCNPIKRYETLELFYITVPVCSETLNTAKHTKTLDRLQTRLVLYCYSFTIQLQNQFYFSIVINRAVQTCSTFQFSHISIFPIHYSTPLTCLYCNVYGWWKVPSTRWRWTCGSRMNFSFTIEEEETETEP